MNSAVSLVRLWHLCVRDQGEEGAPTLRWGILRKTLEGLGCRVQSLRVRSVDEIIRRHFGTGRGDQGHVSFTRYWRGMEEILHTCGVYNPGGVDVITELKVSCLRDFRDAVLDDLLGPDLDGEDADYLVSDLRRICARLQHSTQEVVVDYWQERLDGLPTEEEHRTVTGTEIAAAVLQWLEELLQDALAEAEGFSGYMDFQSEAEEGSSDEDNLATAHPRLHTPGAADARTGGAGGFLLPPPPRRAPGGRGYPVAAHSQAAAGMRQLFPQPAAAPHWLAHAEPEDTAFRDALVQRLGEGVNMSFTEFYRVVRDAVEDEEPDAAGGTPHPRSTSFGSFARPVTPAAIRAGVERLAAVARHRVRETFRMLEVAPAQGGAARHARRAGIAAAEAARGPLGRGGPRDGDLLVALICSQAQTTQELERRAQTVPWAYQLAWILARIRQRRCAEALSRLRDPTAPQQLPMPRVVEDSVQPVFFAEERPSLPIAGRAGLGAAATAESPAGHMRRMRDDLQSPSVAPSPASLPTTASPRLGHAGSPATRRWGGGNRSPTSPPLPSSLSGGSAASAHPSATSSVASIAGVTESYQPLPRKPISKPRQGLPVPQEMD